MRARLLTLASGFKPRLYSTVQIRSDQEFFKLMAQKRPFPDDKSTEQQRTKKPFKSKKERKGKKSGDGSHDEVLVKDIQVLLEQTKLGDGNEVENWDNKEKEELELTISTISSTGTGLAVKNGRAYVVPYTAPGDVVKARAWNYNKQDSYALTDLLEVVKPSEHRTEIPKCPYFANCAGCQFQHLPYAYQLAHKKNVVEKAFRNFSSLPQSSVPAIGDTIASPLQYGYRTKLTPHFNRPPGITRSRKHGTAVKWDGVPNIGFNGQNRKVLDIEDCPIGTEIVRAGLKEQREHVAKTIDTYKDGATILLREHTERQEGTFVPKEGEKRIVEQYDGYALLRSCITNHKQLSTEYVEERRLDTPAGDFFQNNNSILPTVTSYIRQRIKGEQKDGDKPITHLVDAYCGSGLFTITLSDEFENSIGIDISTSSTQQANDNARLNNLSSDRVKFIAGDANELFSFPGIKDFSADETAVVIDPPRKGCDQNFIRQLLKFHPKRICYVSCNVHTQARDIGWLVGGLDHEPGLYEIESLRGFDFFPQTHHVEGVAMLRRKTDVVEEQKT